MTYMPQIYALLPCIRTRSLFRPLQELNSPESRSVYRRFLTRYFPRLYSCITLSPLCPARTITLAPQSWAQRSRLQRVPGGRSVPTPTTVGARLTTGPTTRLAAAHTGHVPRPQNAKRDLNDTSRNSAAQTDWNMTAKWGISAETECGASC